MNLTYRVFSSTLFLLLALVLGAQPQPHFDHPEAADDPSLKFIENAGQWNSNILFQADLPGGKLFLEQGRFLYNFYDLSDFHDKYFHHRGKEDLLIDRHNFFMHLDGANKKAKIEKFDRQTAYHNYFVGDDPDKWRGGVGLYKGMAYRDIYPDIDMVVKALDASIKYEFYVAPGADPNQIRLRFEGLDHLMLNGGNLYLQTSLNEIVEEAPIVWQGEERSPVDCQFRLEGNVLTFEFPNGYDPQKELVIDPTLIFSTYTGSAADNFGYTATYDDQGNLYAGGVAFGQGYDTTAGAFQTLFGGGGSGGLFGPIDVSITKFNPNGTALVYSTYLGGSENEQPHSMIVNSKGELLVTGRTYSVDFPVQGAFQGTNGGAADLFITCFNPAGTGLVGSTYLGGTSDDAVNVSATFGQSSIKFNYGDDARSEIMVDGADNVYVAAQTQSANFPLSTGITPLQNSLSGTQDAVLVKLNGNLSNLLYSTYFGGSGIDGAYAVKVDGVGNAYIAGGTTSGNLPTPSGVVQQAYGGAIDGYIAQINTNLGNLVSATYLGTTAYDQIFALEIDIFGDIYVVGQTLGNYPVSPGVYSNTGGTQFIHKLSPNLNSTFFSTRFGSGSTNVNISPTAFLVDICGFIYVSGWGGNTNFPGNGTTTGMPTTAGAFQTTTDGSDLYLMVLQPDAVALEYATFMGGGTSEEHVDGGTSRFNKDLEVYQAVCAGCPLCAGCPANSDFPTAPGNVWSPTNGSPRCNLAAFKFAFDPQTIVADFNFNVASGCAPFPATFTNNSTGGLNFVWTFGDGSTDTTASPTHVYTVADTYVVWLYIIDSASCNVIDSTFDTVFVYEVPTVAVSGDTSGCNGAPVPLLAGGGTTYQWIPAAGLSNPNIANPWASPTSTTTYQVIVSNPGGCSDTGSVTVTVSNFSAEAGLDASFCEGSGGAMLSGTAYGSTATPFYYTWWCDTTNTYCGLDSVHDNDPIANPTATTTYYLQVTDFNGCISFVDSVQVNVLENPIVDAGPDKYICQQAAPGALINASIVNSTTAPGPYDYQWSPSGGLNNDSILTPYARPDTTTLYTLVVTSLSTGCTSFTTTVDSLSTVMVHVKPRPIAYGGPDTSVCFLDSLELPGYGYAAGPGYKFEWSPATGINDSTLQNPMVSPPATTEYYLTVWSNGCPSIADTVNVTVHARPTADAGPFRDVCWGDTVSLDGEAGGDSTSTGWTYTWTPMAGLLTPGAEDPLVSPDTSLTYYLVVSSSWGCESPMDSARVDLKPTPIAEAGPNLIICDGDSLQLAGSISYGPTPPVPNPSQLWYSWTPAGGIANPNHPTSMAFPPNGTTTYTLTVQYNTCVTSDDFQVIRYPYLDLQAGADTSVICSGDSVGLYASGGLGNASFSWIPASGVGSPGNPNTQAAPDSSTIFWVVIEESGCLDTLEVPVDVIPTPVASYIHSQPTGCAPFEVSFLDNSTDAINWIWNFGDGSPVSNTTNPQHTFTQAGQYPVTLTALGPGNCRSEALETIINVENGPVAAFTSDPSFPASITLPVQLVNFTSLSSGATYLNWDFGDGITSDEANPRHLFPHQGPDEYYVTLTVTDELGCTDEVTHGPYIFRAPDLLIPNVFSPNGDGAQDEFRVSYDGSQPFFLQIFDRWGVLHYESRNRADGWDGKSDAALLAGNQAAEGVYYYKVMIGKKEYVGNVTLLR